MSRRVILWYLLSGIVMAASSHLALSQEVSSTTRITTSTDTSVVISIPRDGEFYFGKDRVTQAEIPDRLKGAFKDKPPEGRVVYIKASLDVVYRTVVSVIDTVRGAGFNQIALVTDADSGSKPQAKSPTGGAGKGKKERGRRRTPRRASK
jgi:biopolymer transport protein ExbD